MGSFLTEVSSELGRELPSWARIHVRNCLFLPQLGFLTVVEMDSETGAGKYDGRGLQGDTWLKAFSAENAVYYKNRRMRELDAHFGDVYGIIVGKSSAFSCTFSARLRCDEATLEGLTKWLDQVAR